MNSAWICIKMCRHKKAVYELNLPKMGSATSLVGLTEGWLSSQTQIFSPPGVTLLLQIQGRLMAPYMYTNCTPLYPIWMVGGVSQSGLVLELAHILWCVSQSSICVIQATWKYNWIFLWLSLAPIMISLLVQCYNFQFPPKSKIKSLFNFILCRSPLG